MRNETGVTQSGHKALDIIKVIILVFPVAPGTQDTYSVCEPYTLLLFITDTFTTFFHRPFQVMVQPQMLK